MNIKQSSTPDTATVDQELVADLLNELDDLFPLFQDGTINDDTFVGGLPMSYLNTDGSLGPLTLEESRKIRQALMESPHRPNKRFGLALISHIDWKHFFKGNDKEKSKANNGQRACPAIIGCDGHLLPFSKDEDISTLIEKRLNTHELPRLSAYWNAINEKLETKHHEEIGGDLRLIDENRRKLTAKRLNATPFEQAAQCYSANISSRFCDENGEIVSPGSLSVFVHALIDNLLERTKLYWPIAPLLAIFDAIVVPVLRPMLHPYQTWRSEHDFFSDNGVFDVGQFVNKRTSLETKPIWNDAAKQRALHLVEEALKQHLAVRFLGLKFFDTFSTYNREVHHSEHLNPSIFKGKIRSFGPPVHTKDIMELVQEIPKKPEEKVLDKIMTYRSSEEGIWH